MESTKEHEAWVALHERARKIGYEHGRNAAEWWEQDAVGGRARGGTERETAENVLRMLDEGDPEIYDSLPSHDLGGEMADSYTSRDLYEELDVEEDDSLELCDSYEEGFSEGVEAGVVAACKAVLE